MIFCFKGLVTGTYIHCTKTLPRPPPHQPGRHFEHGKGGVAKIRIGFHVHLTLMVRTTINNKTSYSSLKHMLLLSSVFGNAEFSDCIILQIKIGYSLWSEANHPTVSSHLL